MSFNLLMVAGGLVAAVAAGIAARLRRSRSKAITTDQVSGDWLILCFHKIVTGTPAANDEISQTGFNTVMDAIQSRSIPVLPVSDVLRYYA